MAISSIDIVYSVTRTGKDGHAKTKTHTLTEKALIEMLSLFHNHKGNRRDINLATDAVEIIDFV
jgi:hypothetical protein